MKGKKRMHDRMMVRLPDEVQDRMAAIHPGNSLGTVSPDGLRLALDTYSEITYKVLTGDITPEDGAVKFEAYLKYLLACGQQFYVSDGSPIEKKAEDKSGA